MIRHGNSKKIAGMRLQDRDLRLLRELGTVIWMSTETIHRRHFPADRSGEAVRRRLRSFAKHGLIESVDLHITTSARSGRSPRFHRILEYGAEVLFDITGVRVPRVLKALPPKPHTIQHRAGMGETLLNFNDACEQKQLPDSEWILEYDPTRSARPNAPFNERFLICDEVADATGRKHRVWPDALSTFNVPHNGTVAQLAIAWEYDRGTETLNQLSEKLEPYAVWLTEKGYQSHFPDALDLRICFVLPSARRMQNVIAAVNKHRIAKYLRFVSVGEFTPEKILDAPIWFTTDGEAKRILPS
jgi:hypothetical protein